jgi:6-phospho-beta-glucosidase
MKIGVIGGAGARTPLLIHGLSQSNLPLTEVRLYDVSEDRLEVIGNLASEFADGFRVTTSALAADCIAGADFVFTTIRVGGIAMRARDEAAVLKLGQLGQETVGACGFAMAIRTIDAVLDYAEQVQMLAPRAWIINFTNPVSIITQAVREKTGARIIGICDTPTELFEDVAHTLQVPSAECSFDFFGLNHLGWLREVFYRGEPLLEGLWEDSDLLEKVYRTPLFETAFLQQLRLLPTEYLYYYYRPEVALENILRTGTSRGSEIAGLNEQFFHDLGAPDADLKQVYRSYLDARDAGYMKIESGTSEDRSKPEWGELTGYDKIAVAVVEAMSSNSGKVLPLNVQNQGNLDCLENSDVVEVPCLVNSNGAIPINVSPIPDSTRDLIVRVKEYERLTIEAAVSRDLSLAVAALAANPLVGNREIAEKLIAGLGVK